MTNGAGGETEWQRAHRALSAIGRRRAELDCVEGKCLLEAERARVHRYLGFGSFAEYVERLLGYTPRTLEEKLRVARALEELPETRRALESARLTWSAVREVTRVATAATERAWLEAATGQTVRGVERLVAGRAPGDLPNDPKQAHQERHHLHFDVSADTFAAFREALRVLRQRSDHALDDDAVLLSMARAVLVGPGDEGRASYQVVVSTCDECGRSFQQSAGEQVGVSAAVREMAACDGQRVDVAAHAGNRATQGEVRRRRAGQSIPPAVRRAVVLRDRRRCRVPGCRHCVFVDVHHIQARAHGGGNDAGNLIVVCSAHHRAVHEGRLVIEGARETEVRFLHADGRPYGFGMHAHGQ